MIGYYVHHHGMGHLARAGQICRQLALLGHEVVGFSSLARPHDWSGDWVELPSDVTAEPVEETAGGVLHWAPIGHVGLRDRMRRMTERFDSITLMVVDVSVEVALLARLFGIPTVVVAMRGDRRDRAHLAAYDAASALLAPWGEEFPENWWPESWRAKTLFVGALSRFDGLQRPGTGVGDVRRRRVLGVWGAGGDDLPSGALDAARSATPGWEWEWRSPAEPSPDLWGELHPSDVVVCHAGNNTVAEVAAARRPAVVVAQSRPFREQHHTVEALRRADLVVALDAWPDAERWPELLNEAVHRGGEGWARWNRRDGAGRAAAALVELEARSRR